MRGSTGIQWLINSHTCIHCSSTGEVKILTKGDNNMGDDREGMIYAPGQNWVTRDEVIGRARG